MSAESPERALLWMRRVSRCNEELGEDGMCDCCRKHFEEIDALQTRIARAEAVAHKPKMIGPSKDIPFAYSEGVRDVLAALAEPTSTTADDSQNV